MASAQYLNWGCEALDLEDSVAPLSPIVEMEFYEIPIEIVSAIVDPGRIGDIAYADRHGIETLASKISAQGQLKPGLAYYNQTKIKLQDGHHRYLAIRDHLHYPTFKLAIEKTDGAILGRGASYPDIMNLILGSLNTRS